jgi:AcrR family transcriptional regulator
MARKKPADRFSQVVEAATALFVREGYQRTQMEDVAERLQIAKGTLYGYVQSKAALFDAALRYADGGLAAPDTTELPWPTPAAGVTLQYIRDRLATEGEQMLLVQAFAAPRCDEAELEAILRDLYQVMRRNRRTIKLVDRCAVDHPELASVWFDEGRWANLELLVSYLGLQMEAGTLPALSQPRIAARLALETVAFWAVHRHWDPSPQNLDEGAVEDVVIRMLLGGLRAGS